MQPNGSGETSTKLSIKSGSSGAQAQRRPSFVDRIRPPAPVGKRHGPAAARTEPKVREAPNMIVRKTTSMDRSILQTGKPDTGAKGPIEPHTHRTRTGRRSIPIQMGAGIVRQALEPTELESIHLAAVSSKRR
jgi:hypothetical protein